MARARDLLVACNRTKRIASGGVVFSLWFVYIVSARVRARAQAREICFDVFVVSCAAAATIHTQTTRC